MPNDENKRVNIQRAELQKIYNSGELPRLIEQKKFYINLENSTVITKQNIGLSSYDLIEIIDYNFSDHKIGPLSHIIFKNCNFGSAKFFGSLRGCTFNGCHISNADFTEVSDITPQQVYLSNDCFQANYNEDKKFKAKLSDYFTDDNKNEYDNKKSMLINIAGDFSPVTSAYINLIRPQNITSNIMDESTIPTKSAEFVNNKADTKQLNR